MKAATIMKLLLAILFTLHSFATAQTIFSIAGEDFQINGKPMYAGREWKGHRIERLLLNSSMV